MSLKLIQAVLFSSLISCNISVEQRCEVPPIDEGIWLFSFVETNGTCGLLLDVQIEFPLYQQSSVCVIDREEFLEDTCEYQKTISCKTDAVWFTNSIILRDVSDYFMTGTLEKSFNDDSGYSCYSEYVIEAFKL